MKEINLNKYRHIINKNNDCDNKGSIKRYLINLVMKFLIVFVVLLSLVIIYRGNNNFKKYISNYFFEDNISFAKINKIYDKYLGGVLPVKREEKVTEVFNEKLNYNSSSIYYDGVKLSVVENYLVPSLEEGMVVFVGNKENYGNTIIIENLDGVDYWYGNIETTSLKLYDYVEKGSFVGTVNNDLYMVVSMDGKYLNYEKYIF